MNLGKCAKLMIIGVKWDKMLIVGETNKGKKL